MTKFSPNWPLKSTMTAGQSLQKPALNLHKFTPDDDKDFESCSKQKQSSLKTEILDSENMKASFGYIEHFHSPHATMGNK